MCVAAKHTRRVGSEREGAERDALVPDRGRDGGGQLGGEGQQSVGGGEDGMCGHGQAHAP